MGNKGGIEATQFEKVEDLTDFNKEQIQATWEKFKKKFPNGKLTKDEFITELSDIGGSPDFWEKIYNSLSKDNSGMVDFAEFMLGINFFNSESSIKDKLSFAFRMYDTDGNGYLDESELSDLLDKIFRVESLTTKQKNHTAKVVDKMKLLGSQKNDQVQINLDQWLEACEGNEKIVHAVNSCILSAIEIKESKKELTVFNHQAAGHGGLLKDGKTIHKLYSQQEFKCYEKFKNFPEIQSFVPEYFGRTRILNEETGQAEHYIIMEDLTYGMEQPCIMDLKMGKYTYEPNAPVKKKTIQSTIDILSTSDTLGFRICGIRTYIADKDDYLVRDKPWGVRVPATEMASALKLFIHNGEKLNYEIFKESIPKLRKMEEWLQKQTSFRFYGSSILFVYDGKKKAKAAKVVVKMVDFAHTVIDSDSKDESYLFGLSTLIKLLENICHEGEANKEGESHDFKLVYFKKPTFCRQCTKFIWGVASKQGYECTGCGYTAHKDCSKIIPKNCTKTIPLSNSIKKNQSKS